MSVVVQADNSPPEYNVSDLEFRTRMDCKGCPFEIPDADTDYCKNPPVVSYRHSLITSDNVHDVICPMPTNTTKGSNDFENDMMEFSRSYNDNEISKIFCDFGTIKDIEQNDDDKLDDKSKEKSCELNKNKCHIVDIFSGTYYCPGYNNYIDSANKSYDNFLTTVGLKNPFNKDTPFLFQQNDIFKFTALFNYDLLLYAALIDEDIPAIDANLDFVKEMNVKVMNYFWGKLMDETEKVVDGDFFLEKMIWKDHYKSAVKLLQTIKFSEVSYVKKDGVVWKWKIDRIDSDDEYFWGITQGASANMIITILKKIVRGLNIFRCCKPRTEKSSKNQKVNECAIGLKTLCDTQRDDNVSASLHALCKFIGDSSHITFGNIIQEAKNKMANDKTKIDKLIELRKKINPPPSALQKLNQLTYDDIKSIKVCFWVSERPMATRLCLDKLFVEEYSVGIKPTQIIKKLYKNNIWPSDDKDRYLLVDFDKMTALKASIKDLNEMFDFLLLLDNVNEPAKTIIRTLKVIIQPIEFASNEGDESAITGFETFIVENNAKLDDLKVTYKLEKIKQDLINTLPDFEDKLITPLVSALEHLNLNGRDMLATDPNGIRSRKVASVITESAWYELSKPGKKDAVKLLKKMSSFCSLMILLCELDKVNASQKISEIKISNVKLYWLIKNIGRLYENYTESIVEVIRDAIEVNSEKKNESFILDASTFIENIVSLNKQFTSLEPNVGGGVTLIEELMSRRLHWTTSIKSDDDALKEKINDYCFNIERLNTPPYYENPPRNVKQKYEEDKELVNAFLSEIKKTGVSVDANDKKELYWIGPFEIDDSFNIVDKDENKILKNMAIGMINYELLSTTSIVYEHIKNVIFEKIGSAKNEIVSDEEIDNIKEEQEKENEKAKEGTNIEQLNKDENIKPTHFVFVAKHPDPHENEESRQFKTPESSPKPHESPLPTHSKNIQSFGKENPPRHKRPSSSNGNEVKSKIRGLNDLHGESSTDTTGKRVGIFPPSRHIKRPFLNQSGLNSGLPKKLKLVFGGALDRSSRLHRKTHYNYNKSVVSRGKNKTYRKNNKGRNSNKKTKKIIRGRKHKKTHRKNKNKD